MTFLEELASLSETTVSMVSTVVPETSGLAQCRPQSCAGPRTGGPDAISIAEKYRLTYECLNGADATAELRRGVSDATRQVGAIR